MNRSLLFKQINVVFLVTVMIPLSSNYNQISTTLMMACLEYNKAIDN